MRINKSIAVVLAVVMMFVSVPSVLQAQAVPQQGNVPNAGGIMLCEEIVNDSYSGSAVKVMTVYDPVAPHQILVYADITVTTSPVYTGIDVTGQPYGEDNYVTPITGSLYYWNDPRPVPPTELVEDMGRFYLVTYLTESAYLGWTITWDEQTVLPQSLYVLGTAQVSCNVSQSYRYWLNTYVGKDGNCGGNTPCVTTIQQGIDIVPEFGNVMVSWETYTDVNSLGGLAQAVYVNKPLNLEGGWQPDFEYRSWDIMPTQVNVEYQGRGIYVASGITVTIGGMFIEHGSAEGLGGGTNNEDAGGAIYLAGSSSEVNSSVDAGGVISWPVVITHTSLIRSQAQIGGGLYSDHQYFRFGYGQAVENTVLGSGNGAGFYLDGGVGYLHNNLFTYNVVDPLAEGSVVYARLGFVSLTLNRVNHNSGRSTIAIDGQSQSSISRNDISHNFGMGVYLYNGSNSTISNNTIHDFEGSDGVRVEDSDAVLLYNTVASYVMGAGVYVFGDSDVQIMDTIFSDCETGVHANISTWGDYTPTVVIDTSLFWNNGRDWTSSEGVEITVINHLHGDPMFIDSPHGDYQQPIGCSCYSFWMEVRPVIILFRRLQAGLSSIFLVSLCDIIFQIMLLYFL